MSGHPDMAVVIQVEVPLKDLASHLHLTDLFVEENGPPDQDGAPADWVNAWLVKLRAAVDSRIAWEQVCRCGFALPCAVAPQRQVGSRRGGW